MAEEKDVFQSAPLTGARGDCVLPLSACLNLAFQSAPLTGARGDAMAMRTASESGGVSIRSPDRGQGRHPPPGVQAVRLRFQSAPLTGARGDQVEPPVGEA